MRGLTDCAVSEKLSYGFLRICQLGAHGETNHLHKLVCHPATKCLEAWGIEPL
jgi:hypothetical protein